MKSSDLGSPSNGTELMRAFLPGRVLRRGRTLTACEAEIRTESGRLVAKALGNYKVG
ncbi:hypothetical protein GII30_07920 [Gordonia amarae]|uniref:Uncharacterized protein n=1 Tax=Gordonia amarae TaxID=36821 RepID=A0A857LL61_9ACTN|nr:hypothetical protein [Gordonia amarae]MCS3878307.1 acyl-coenzyme A thioesterase PaaI-like protein [Gordonia amarae]QHN16956.1 hypothetical protein GII35_08145 [Gordonia amarae]QHN21482.1 hypothetical protein GII34_07925 [Gordonia amarae]QHN30332.1 hypothetical protein GII32_07935 [Gordonia amarae]QHN39109.1 hypothetical protein GII30_07920 [Gordonia amarae]